MLAISIIVRASILIALAYASYWISARDSSSAFVNTLNLSNNSTALSVVIAGIASTIDLMFGSPLLSASATHSSEYPFPLKMILWFSVRYSLIRSCTARSKSSAFSRISHASANASATIVFSTIFGFAIESLDPTIRNSNLFPVNANGDVLFLSVASLNRSGSVLTPVSSFPPFRLCVASPVLINCSTTSSSCSPRKIEIIAGGASFAPSLWSFPGSAADSLSRSACLLTAFRMQASTRRNCVFS